MIACGWCRTFVSVRPLVCDMELQRVMVSYLSIALASKGLKDPVGLYTGGMSDPTWLEQGTCACVVSTVQGKGSPVSKPARAKV